MSLLQNDEVARSVQALTGLETPPTLSIVGSSARGLLGPDWIQVTPAAAYQYWRVAHEAALAARVSRPEVFDCNSTATAACAASGIAAFASRAFRRPIESEELADLVDLYRTERDAGGSHADGIEAVIEAVLQAPSFLYRTELGAWGLDGRYQLTPFERASFIASLLTGSAPDEALWAAAQGDALRTETDWDAQVDRILDTGAARDHISSLILRWLGTNDVTLAEKSAPEFSPALALRMAQETARFVDHAVWSEEGTLAGLLTSRRTFVDEALAAHLGMAYPKGASGWVAVETSGEQRLGFLTQASLLTRLSGVSTTSVVRRGLFVARDLLCEPIPPPDPTAVQAAASALTLLPDERARAAYRMSGQPCGSCHSKIDPYGLIFESYDELGRFRAYENGVPIDPSWDFEAGPAPGMIIGVPQLAQRLSTSAPVLECAARRFEDHAFGYESDAFDRDARERFRQSQGNWRQLFHDLALSSSVVDRSEVLR